jgi:IstB-like ATP binding protein
MITNLEHKPDARGRDHDEWLGLLLGYETTLHRQKQFEARPAPPSCATAPASRTSTFRTCADLIARLFLKFAACDQMEERSNILITGAAGLDKSWLACAFGYTAGRENISVLYARVRRTRKHRFCRGICRESFKKVS